MIKEVVLIGITFSLMSVLIANIVSHREFFAKAIASYRVLSKVSVNEEAKDKRSLRKLRKIRSDLKKTRQRLTLLFIIDMAIFMLMYLGNIITVYLLYPGRTGVVEIPFGIPFLSYKIGSHYYTHAVIISFLAFMMPSYLFARIVKFK